MRTVNRWVSRIASAASSRRAGCTSIDGTYYFSYSTGDTHLLVYATGDNPYGPFTYHGVVLTPVVGWTTHHSILEYKGKWWLFYHDSSLSGGKDAPAEREGAGARYRADGSIVTIDGLS